MKTTGMSFSAACRLDGLPPLQVKARAIPAAGSAVLRSEAEVHPPAPRPACLVVLW